MSATKRSCEVVKMIGRYQLKNSTVSAVLYDGSNFDEVDKFTNGKAYKPYYIEHGVRVFTLDTQFGECRVYPNTYIVHIRGRLFVAVTPDLFHDRYEKIPSAK